MAEPFVKWVGGKRQLLKEIILRLPSDFGNPNYRRYAEPFVGGGAVLFELFSRDLVDEAIIVDINADLILTYQMIKSHPNDVIDCLYNFQVRYDESNYEERKKMYFATRELYNELTSVEPDSLSLEGKILRACQFIFLNKTGFNGLYRVNKEGRMNVPPSHLKNKKIYSEDNILSVSKVLQNVSIIQGSYVSISSWVTKNTLVYFDPPYRPITQTSFTNYSIGGFDDLQQGKLAEFCHNLTNNGIDLLISNSNPKKNDPNDQFFYELFPEIKGYVHQIVQARRQINSKGKERGKIEEIMISNYKS